MKNKFLTAIYSTINIENLKQIYDYVEEYNDEKIYPTEIFTEMYTGTPKKYSYMLYYTSSTKYVVAKREYTEDELMKLEKYCNCPKCIRAWYNITRFCYCPCCYGCIGAGPDFVNDSRVKYAESKLKEN